MPRKKASKSAGKNVSQYFTADNESETDDEPMTSMRIDPRDFVACFKSALADKEIQETLQSVIAPVISDMRNEISEMRDNLDMKTNEINKLQEEIDDLKQSDKGYTLRIEGLMETPQEDVRDTVCRFVTETLEVQLSTWEIDYCFRVGKQTDQNQKAPRKIVLRLLSQNKKKKILFSKKKLRGMNSSTPVFINEDLIPKRGQIFKDARLAVKDGQLSRTWVFEGQIYVKKTDSSEGEIVKSLPALNMIKCRRN